MTEQSESELDWKDVSVLVFIVGTMIAVITALAIHFGYGDRLSHGVNWLAHQWRDHVAGEYFGKCVDEFFEAIRNYFKHHHLLPRRLP